MKKNIFMKLAPLLPLVVVAALLEILVKQKVIPSYLLPAPSQVFDVFSEESQTLFEAAMQTFMAAVFGFILSFIIGILSGIVLASHRLFQNIFYPYISFFQTVPIIAIAPLLVIWFGYGLNTIVISSFIVSLFPMIASTLKGLLSTDLSLVDLFRLYRATPSQLLLKLRLPYAVPHIVVGAEISAGLSVIGAIVGEFIAGGGLGGMIDTSRTQQRIDIIAASVILASVIGLILLKLVSLISKKILHSWHPSEQ